MCPARFWRGKMDDMEARVLDGVLAQQPVLGRGIILLTGAASLLLGTLVIFGWHTGNYALVQLHPTFVPMQYNTALGFLAAGLGVLALAADRPRLSAGAGWAALLIGAVTGSQYLFGFNLGIDELLMDHEVTVQTSDPGRMAPNTALCFSIAGLTLVLAVMLRDGGARQILARIGGLALLALSVVAMLGYLSGVETAYGWANLTRMALHTALGFLILGAGFVAASLTLLDSGKGQRSPLWWSGAVVAVGVLATVALTQNIQEHDSRWRNKTTGEAADLVATKIDAQMQVAIAALRRMAHRWQADNGSPAESWIHDADRYVADFGSMTAIHWLDRQYDRRLSSTGADSDESMTEQIHRQLRATDWSEDFDPDHEQATLFKGRRDGGLSTMAIIVPTYSEGRLDGHLAAELSVAALLETGWSSGVLQDFQYRVEADGQLIHQSDALPADWQTARTTEFDVIGTTIRTSAIPKLTAAGQPGFDTNIVLAVGILFSLVSGLSVHLAITNGRTTVLLAGVNQQLEGQSARLQQSNLDLERSNHQLDEFAYIASHDLKEPLRAISNHSRYLLEDHEDSFEEDGVKRLHRMIFLCERLDQLISDLLHFSRLGRQEKASRMTDLNALVHDVESVFEETLKEANARIVLTGELPSIVCETERVAELFRNLIGNAIKYNDSTEKIVEIGVADAETRTLFVRDNGIGIDSEHHEDIFRIFKRLHGPSRYGGGTGSGLTFVKKIVEEHGGHVRVESAPGQGTTFLFTLEGEKT